MPRHAHPPDSIDLDTGPSDDPMRRRDAVARAARSLAFGSVAVADATASAHADAVRAWIAAGRHGSMAWLEGRLEERLDPDRYLDGARSIVCVLDRHPATRDRRSTSGPARGRVARYARGRDYHDLMKKRLHRLADAIERAFPGQRAIAAVDTAPILEREHAARAGLGAIGKHTLLIEPGIGSWCLLGEIVTTVEIAPSRAPGADRTDVCGGCTRCIDACPTDAITPFSVDATRCVSYLTLEHRGPIDPALHAPIGDWIAGCDVCQEVCPHAQPTRRSRRTPTHAELAARRDGFDLLDVLGWTEADRRDAFTTSALKRVKLTQLKRNALICAGNALREAGARATGSPPEPSPDRKAELGQLRSRIEAIALDDSEDELLRRTARIVLDRLSQE